MDGRNLANLAGLVSALVIGMAAMGGCTESSSGRMWVTGEVRLDGKPLEKGTIRFIQMGRGKNTSDAGRVFKGKFGFYVTPGKKVVSIESFGPVTINMATVKDHKGVRNILPPKWNQWSELRAEVGGPKKNHFKFDLWLDSELDPNQPQ